MTMRLCTHLAFFESAPCVETIDLNDIFIDFAERRQMIMLKNDVIIGIINLVFM